MVQGGTNWQPVKVGTILKSGTVLQTAIKSSVDIVFNDADAVASGGMNVSPALTPVVHHDITVEQDAVRVMPNTVLAIDKLTISQTGAETVSETMLDLKVGRIFGTVKKLSPASRYEVKIPNGVAAIRGTAYLLGADGGLSVGSGSVILGYVKPDGSSAAIEVAGGQQFNLTTPNDPPHIMSPAELEDIKAISNEVGSNGHGFNPVVYVGPDRTLFYVSPTRGSGVNPPQRQN